MCPVQGDTPGPISRMNQVCAEFQLKAPVAQLGRVTLTGLCSGITQNRDRLIIEGIYSQVIIEIDTSGEPITEKLKVKTDISRMYRFPSQLLIH